MASIDFVISLIPNFKLRFDELNSKFFLPLNIIYIIVQILIINMRLLKRKIEATTARLLTKSTLTKETQPSPQPELPQKKSLKTRNTKHIQKSKRRTRVLSKIALVTKNLVKNFGRAIANFAQSELAFPYLQNFIQSHPTDTNGFEDYCLFQRDNIQTIETFKEACMPQEEDDKILSGHKKLFQHLALVFMKYFSVNWIFSGRMMYKEEYLKFRGPLLRRIKDPEAFIYIFKRKK